MTDASQEAIRLNEKVRALKDSLTDTKQARDRVLASADAQYRPRIESLETDLEVAEEELREAMEAQS